MWNRIDSIKSVSKVLFRDWEKELDAYTNQDLRQSSEDQMNQTHIQYLKLIRTMEIAAEKMNLVLDVFRDQTLYLKHNLNTQAIAALNQTLMRLCDDTDLLIQQMSVSIDEVSTFIAKMRANR